MDIDEAFAQFLEHRELHRGVVDEGTALAGCQQFATYDAVSGVVLDVVVTEEGIHIIACQVEMGLDDALVGSLFDGL